MRRQPHGHAAEQYRYVIGGDPDRDTIDLAVLDTTASTSPTAPMGPAMKAWWRGQTSTPQEPRVWALEGTGSFAAGLARLLADVSEKVLEISAVKRARSARNDQIDAVRAAREALDRDLHRSFPRPIGMVEFGGWPRNPTSCCSSTGGDEDPAGPSEPLAGSPLGQRPPWPR